MVSRKKILLIIAISAVLVLSSCTMVAHITVKPDGSGTYNFSFTITKEDMAILLGQYVGNLDIDEDEFFDYLLGQYEMESMDDLCSLLGFEFQPVNGEAEVKGEEKNGVLECEMSVAFDNLDELIDYNELFDPVGSGKTFAIDEEAGEFTFEAVFSESNDILEVEEIGVDISIMYKITAPGKVSSHNGTSVSGTTVTWDLVEMSKESEDLTMTLTSSTSGGGSDTTTILIVAAVVVVIIFLSQKKKSDEEM